MKAGLDLWVLLAQVLAADRDGWEVDALCREVDPELWFPEKGASTAPAKAICGRCDVRPECLRQALTRHERFGVYAGLSERQRRPLQRLYDTWLAREPEQPDLGEAA